MSMVGKSAIHFMIENRKYSSCKLWAGVNSAERITSNELLKALTLLYRTRKHTNIQSLHCILFRKFRIRAMQDREYCLARQLF